MANNIPEWVESLQLRLINASIKTLRFENVVKDLCLTCRQNGLELDRLVIGAMLIHPRYSGIDYSWTTETPKVEVEKDNRTFILTEEYQNSPFTYMISQNVSFLRAQLFVQPPKCEGPYFPIYEKFKSQNYTDYVGFAHNFGENEIVLPSSPTYDKTIKNGVPCSFSTKKPEGFSQYEIQIMQSLSLFIAIAVKTKMMSDFVSVIAQTYIGERAGEKVLSGEIDRGSVDSIEAIIWFGDLRGFTKLSSVIPPQQLIDGLNEYLEVVSDPLINHGGEILKYMGDGVLGIIEIQDDAEIAATKALKAAEETFQKIRSLTEKRRKANDFSFEFDLALHTGTVSYGNIGSLNRLDFTVIGSPVNEAARMETLCTSDQKLVLSKDFIELLSIKDSRIQSIGMHQFKGISESKEIFNLKI